MPETGGVGPSRRQETDCQVVTKISQEDVGPEPDTSSPYFKIVIVSFYNSDIKHFFTMDDMQDS